MIEAIKKAVTRVVIFIERVVIPCLGIVFVLAIIGFALNDADKNGYIPHFSKSPVLYPEHGWEVGQYVRCYIGRPTSEEPYLECNNEDMKSELMRKMDATIWGRVTKTPVYYSCQRKETSIVCHLDRS